MKFVYTDGADICLYDNGKITKQECGFFKTYKNNLESLRRSRAWKQSGEGAKFRGDDDYESAYGEIEGTLSGVCMAGGDKVAYSYIVNETSVVYTKDFSIEKNNEAHVINSAESAFSGVFCDSKNEVIACSVQNGTCNADIALIKLNGYDYKSVTGGDTMDEYPFISPDDSNKIYFSSRGVGRTSEGSFAGFSPSYICLLNLDEMEVSTVRENKESNYFKPVYYNGELYCIKTPLKQRRGNLLLDIVLLPLRFLQAIANLFRLFIVALTGKNLVSGETGGNNPTKKREQNQNKIFIRGNLINVDKETKRNSRKKQKDYGFIPLSWKIVKGDDEVLFSGAADFDIDGDGNLLVTNGKHIFAIKNGERKKLCDCEYCVNISCLHESSVKASIFDL